MGGEGGVNGAGAWEKRAVGCGEWEKRARVGSGFPEGDRNWTKTCIILCNRRRHVNKIISIVDRTFWKIHAPQ